MKKYSILIIAFLIMASFSSCKDNKAVKKDRSTGSTSEILVVTQNAMQWEGRLGDTIRAFFQANQYGLPQPEPQFKLTHITMEAFNGIFEKYRNILWVVIDKSKANPIVEIESNFWAAPQRVVKITAPNIDSWIAAFEPQKQELKVMFEQMERERLIEYFRPTQDVEVMNILRKSFNIEMLIPEGFYVAKDMPDFMWLRKKLSRVETGFFIYTVPYTDTTDLNPRRLIQVRDFMLKQYVPGPMEGTYMSTDKEVMLPKIEPTSLFVTDYAVEARGLWTVEGDWMGGPFLSYTVVTPDAKELLTVEAYIYAPNQDKRDYLRQLEAMLYSLKFEELNKK